LENGYNESFNGKMRDKLLDRENFFTLEKPNLNGWLERGVKSRQITRCFRISFPCIALVACSTAGYCTRSNITTGTIIEGRSAALLDIGDDLAQPAFIKNRVRICPSTPLLLPLPPSPFPGSE